MNPKVTNYSLSELETLQELLVYIRNSISQHRSFLYKEESDKQFIPVIAKGLDPFAFVINSISQNQNREVQIEYAMSPWTEIVTKVSGEKATKSRVIKRFDQWIEYIQRYNVLSFDDPIIASYTEELYEAFKIIGPKADREPFNIRQQAVLIGFLEGLKDLNKQTPNKYQKVIDQSIDETIDSVVSEPKNEVIRKLSKVFAYSKKVSLRYAKLFLETFEKEVLKKGLYKLADKA